MSTKGTIYKAIADRLMDKLTFSSGDLQSLQFVDLNRGQFDNPEQLLYLPLPGILIKFAEGEYEGRSRGSQTGTQLILIDIGYENYSSAAEGSIDQEAALAYLEFQEKVFVALQGWGMEYCTSLDRIADEDIGNMAGSMLVTRIVFVTEILDNAAKTDTDYTIKDNVVPQVEYTETITRPAMELPDDGFVSS